MFYGTLYLNRENNAFAFHCLASSSLAPYWQASRERLLPLTVRFGAVTRAARLERHSLAVSGARLSSSESKSDNEELVLWLGPGQDALQLHQLRGQGVGVLQQGGPGI